MSIIFTESFVDFPTVTKENFTTNIGTEYAAMLVRAGMVQGTTAGSAYPFIQETSNNPTGKCLKVYATAITSNYRVLSFQNPRMLTGHTYIFGVNLFIPETWTLGSSEDNVFEIGYTNTRLFWFGTNLKITTTGTGTVIPDFSLSKGKNNSIELVVDTNAGSAKLYINDFYVGLIPSGLTLANFSLFSLILKTSTKNIDNEFDFGWEYSDIYGIICDDIEPNERIGSSARVLGTKPLSDYQKQWDSTNPSESNASIVSGNLESQLEGFESRYNSWILATESNTTDLYNFPEREEVSEAFDVKGINVKGVLRNNEETLISSRLEVRDSEGSVDPAKTKHKLLNTPGAVSGAFTAVMFNDGRGLIGAADSLTNANTQYYVSSYPNIRWEPLDYYSSTSANGNYFSTEGGTVLVAKVGANKLLYLTPGQDVYTGWVTIDLPFNITTSHPRMCCDDNGFILVFSTAALIQVSTDYGQTWTQKTFTGTTLPDSTASVPYSFNYNGNILIITNGSVLTTTASTAKYWICKDVKAASIVITSGPTTTVSNDRVPYRSFSFMENGDIIFIDRGNKVWRLNGPDYDNPINVTDLWLPATNTAQRTLYRDGVLYTFSNTTLRMSYGDGTYREYIGFKTNSNIKNIEGLSPNHEFIFNDAQNGINLVVTKNTMIPSLSGFNRANMVYDKPSIVDKVINELKIGPTLS